MDRGRDCKTCIFHDERCTRWDCRYISREDAEKAIDEQIKKQEIKEK